MPVLISKPETGWKIQVTCSACKYVYEYTEFEVVIGEEPDPTQTSVYCGHCKRRIRVHLPDVVYYRVAARRRLAAQDRTWR